MKRYYLKFPGSFYAYGPVEATTEKEARAAAREILDVKRLPAGFECWPTTD